MNTQNLITKKPSRKLKNIYNRKYAVKKIISLYAIKLELFSELQIHPIFDINLLKLAATNPYYPGHIQFLRSLIEIDKEIEYEILEIVDFCLFRKTKRL